MRRVAYHLPVLLLVLPAGCAMVRNEPPPRAAQVEIIEDPVPIDWKNVITPADQARLARATDAWTQGLAAAARFSADIKASGPLLDPKAALARPTPSPGAYLCHMVRLGGKPAYATFKRFDCYVEAEGELLTLMKATGSQRPAGRLWHDNETGMVFLGALGPERAPPPAYGADATRDVVGQFERVGPFRWRLVVPFPQTGGILDVYELVPYVPPTS